MMKIKYLIATPFCVNAGGTSQHTKSVIDEFSKLGIEILPLDFTTNIIDFDTLLVFSFSYHNPDMLEKFSKLGIKIVLIPIFDRTKPKWTFSLYNLFEKTPIRTLYNQRKRILDSATIVLANCDTEKRELMQCFKTDEKKIHVLRLGINPIFYELDKVVTKDLFFEKYGFTDFIIYSAAEINQRKNQLALLRSVSETNIKVVFTGCDNILVPEFEMEIKKNHNVLCLGKISLEELVSAYKCAKISISLSSSETAGLALLESAYFGCNVIASDIPAFREYLGDIANFLPSVNTKNILQAIQSSSTLDEKSTTNRQAKQKIFVQKNYSWEKYVKNILSL